MKKLVACMLLVAPPALAEFTAQEKAQINAQVEALYDSGRIYTWATSHLTSRPQDAALVQTVLNQVLAAREFHLRGLLYLLDMEGGDGIAIDSMTRAQARQAGIDGILSGSSSYNPAIATINSMVATSGLTTMKQLLQGAEAKRVALDATLAYAEPRVAENVAMPGATRMKSANAGSHGDYRRFGELSRSFEIQSARWIRAAAAAAVQNSAFVPTLQFVAEKMNRIQSFTGVMVGLVVGVEHFEFTDDVDVQFANGTTQRSRHFWRISMILEILLGWDHGVESHDFSRDVFGRVVTRGLVYELTAACRSMSDFALQDASTPAYVKSVLEADKQICESWSSLDGMAQNNIVFRYFTNVGPPGQVVGVCGAGTTLQPGPPPTCVATSGSCPSGQSCQPPCPTCPPAVTCGSGTTLVGSECVADPCPTCPPQVTCGAGTHLEGSTCVADPAPSCPTFHAELSSTVELDRIEYRALCVQNP